jgi:tRNA(Ile)-lysidine synthetase-like protein
MPYPKPGPVGGKLIREVIRALRECGTELPITSHILIADSGGLDSTALTHLIAKYGRRIAATERLKLIHVNHGWRGAESDGDQAFVETFGRDRGIEVLCQRVPGETIPPGSSPELRARSLRKQVFQQVCLPGDFIFTAHHADDLAETMLWRLLTGQGETHGGGIALKHENEVRPLLRVRKFELEAFLREESVSWREDRTNFEGELLRTRMRKNVMPELERLFPRAVQHLSELGLTLQASAKADAERLYKDGDGEMPRSSRQVDLSGWEGLLGASGLSVRRSHYRQIRERLESEPGWQGELHLENGWKIRRELTQAGKLERWIAEKKVEATAKRRILNACMDSPVNQNTRPAPKRSKTETL